jgi:hypothetical protein
VLNLYFVITAGETQNMQEIYNSVADLKVKTAQVNQNIDRITGFMNPKAAVQTTKRNKGVTHKLKADEVVGLFGDRSHGKFSMSNLVSAQL